MSDDSLFGMIAGIVGVTVIFLAMLAGIVSLLYVTLYFWGMVMM